MRRFVFATTVFTTVGVLCLFTFLTLTSTARADEAAAIAALEKLGAKIMRDEKKPSKPIVEVKLTGAKVTDADLAGLVPHLKELKSLPALTLTGAAVTDAGLAHLKELKSLPALVLAGTKVTDAGLVHLKELKSLTFVSLSGTAVTDAGLVHLKELNSLTAIRLQGAKNVTDAGVADLRKALPKCQITR